VGLLSLRGLTDEMSAQNSFRETYVQCFMDYGCQNIPISMYHYCFNVLLCAKDQCMVNGVAGLRHLSVASVLLAVAATILNVGVL
jgi:hypothetical protein